MYYYYHTIVVLVSSVWKGSDYVSFSIWCIDQAGAECMKIAYSLRVRIALDRVAPNVGCNKSFDPLGNPGSDFNPVIRTDCMGLCKVC